MRAVYDTNIFISAFLLPGSQADKAYRLAIRGTVQLYSSPAIITEVASKLRQKFGWDAENIVAAVRSIGRVAIIIKPAIKLEILTDAPDNRILECAVESQADLIVTGDRHLLELKTFQRVPIVRLRDFLRNFPG